MAAEAGIIPPLGQHRLEPGVHKGMGMGRVLPFAELFDMALAALRGFWAVRLAEGIVDLGEMGEGGTGGKAKKKQGCKAMGGGLDDFFRHGGHRFEMGGKGRCNQYNGFALCPAADLSVHSGRQGCFCTGSFFGTVRFNDIMANNVWPYEAKERQRRRP
jgi:hypothetical protein